MHGCYLAAFKACCSAELGNELRPPSPTPTLHNVHIGVRVGIGIVRHPVCREDGGLATDLMREGSRQLIAPTTVDHEHPAFWLSIGDTAQRFSGMPGDESPRSPVGAGAIRIGAHAIAARKADGHGTPRQVVPGRILLMGDEAAQLHAQAACCEERESLYSRWGFELCIGRGRMKPLRRLVEPAR